MQPEASPPQDAVGVPLEASGPPSSAALASQPDASTSTRQGLPLHLWASLAVLYLGCSLVGKELNEQFRPRVELAHGYLLWAILLTIAVHLSPRRLRDPLVAGCGVGYLAWSASPAFAAACVIALLLLHAILAAARRTRLAILAYLLWVVSLNVTVAGHLFTVYTPEALNALLTAEMAMGWVLSRILKRSTYALYEVRIGRVRGLSLSALASYMVGLPANGSFSTTPSLRSFLDAQPTDPAKVQAVVWRGLVTTATCMACLYGSLYAFTLVWHQRPLLFRPVYAEPYALWPIQHLWVMVLAFELVYFLQRMATEQLSVGIWRLLGHDLGDSFRASALVAPSVTGYWKHWNIPWNEFLASSLYYPILLGLGRRAGRCRPWMHGLAGALTMLGGTVFDLFPRALLFAGHMSPAAAELLLSFALYHLLWAVLLGGTLAYQAARPKHVPQRRFLTPLWVVLTYAAVSWCRIFEQVWPLEAKLTYILRAFGLR